MTEGGAGSSSAGSGSQPRHNPLAVTYPSPMMLVHYPLFATNVRVLCSKDPLQRKSQGSLAATIQSLRRTFEAEGPAGLYRGGHLYLLHQATREGLRFLADRLISALERRSQVRQAVALKDVTKGGTSTSLEVASHRRTRLVVKYLIDALCYPVLLASTRAIIVEGDGLNSWERVCTWCRWEGLLSLFGGMVASLLSTALDEAAEYALGWLIDQAAQGTEIELADKLLLKASASSVTSIFTAPISYVGVIQRCQSRIPGLMAPRPLWGTVYNLPWRGSLLQLALFGGVFLLNVKLIQYKLALQAEEAEEVEDDGTE